MAAIRPFDKDSELVLGLVAPIGADLDNVGHILAERFGLFRYTTNSVRLSYLLKELGSSVKLKEAPAAARYNTYMDAGNEARKQSGHGDFLALSAAYKLQKMRAEKTGAGKPLGRVAHVLRSLKHPDEVHALRMIYGSSFFLVGVHAPLKTRLEYLTNDKDISERDANKLIVRDEAEDEPFGQRTRDTFELCDAFVSLQSTDYKDQLWRILDLLFGGPHITPTFDEHAMFLAYGASLRSGDLSRQVGAVVVSKDKEVIGTGANDVPKFGGGLYSADDEVDQRDWKRGFDSNEKVRDKLAEQIVKELLQKGSVDEEVRQKLGRAGVLDITEYGRAVHAEMDALLACARSGVSPRGGTLFSTTFPCHNCAKHIVAAGISRVVYVEPYPKSRALDLHDDSITLDGEKNKVAFEPFVGVGPRRFVDLFSMGLGSGRRIERKRNGKTIKWNRRNANIRIPNPPQSYLDREKLATADLVKMAKGRVEGAKKR